MLAKCRLLGTFTVALSIAHGATVPLAHGRENANSPVAAVLKAQGTVAANLGRYDEAIERFSKAYAVEQDPLLLFKLAQVYRVSGQAEKALTTYSAFLRAAGGLYRFRVQVERATAEIESITTFVLRRAAEPPAPQPIAAEKTNQPAASSKAATPEELAPAPLASKVEKVEEVPAVVESPAPVTKREPVPVEVAPAPLSAPAMNFTPEAVVADSNVAKAEPSPVHKRWWFWTGVAGALVAGGVATWYYARPAEPVPGSTYGSVRVLP